MPHSRRRRRDEFEDDDGSDEDGARVHDARSALQAKKKRPRVSIEEPPRRPTRRGSSSEPDTESDSGRASNDAPENDDQVPTSTQYELMRDGDFSHLDHADLDDQHCTQLIQTRRHQAELAENRIAENGIIVAIECINFMCHERLNVRLGPLLNFVVGENGSGKSAVLTAIMICLGGKASATNRGGSLKALIKEGKDTARLKVVLKNEGDGAYKPDLYGDRIIIERQFSRNGSPSFKVKSKMERTISTKKADVDDITEYFALQVDNPLNILSQDNARQFLNASSATQKYNFWVQGVNLQALDQDYRVVQEMVAANEDRHQNFRSGIEALRKRKEEAKRLVQVASKNAELKEKQGLLRGKLVWAQVVEKERILEKYRADYAEANARLERAQEPIQVCEEEHNKLKDKETQIVAALDVIKQEMKEFEEQAQEARREVGAAEALKSEFHVNERQSKANLDRCKKILQKKEQSVANEESRLRALDDGEMARLSESVDQAQETLREMEAQKRQKTLEWEGLGKRRESAQKDATATSQKMNRKKADINQSKSRLESLTKGQRDAYLAFDPKTRRLLSEIERERSFQVKPVGPIGLHMQLKKPQWAYMIDKYIGQNLDAYVVANSTDQTKLRAMMNRIGINAPIIKSSQQRLNVSGQEPEEGVDTILRVLNIDDPRCRDCLIMNNSIEQVVLMPDRKEAENFMFRESGGAPRNVKACITFAEGHPGQGLLLQASQHGFSTTPMDKRNAPGARLKISDASQIALEEETLTGLQDELSGLQQDFERAQRACRGLEAEWAAHSTDVRTLESEMRNGRSKIQTLRDKMSGLEGDDGMLQQLKDERDEARDTYETAGRTFGELALKKAEHEEVLALANEKLQGKRTEQADHVNRIAKMEKKHERIIGAVSIALQRKNQAYEDQVVKQAVVARLEGKIAEQKEEVESIESQAVTHFPQRIPIGEDETYESLDRKYRGIREQLRRAEQRQGKSDEAIHRDYVEARRELKAAAAGYSNCVADLRTLKMALAQRLVLWRQFQRSISAWTRSQFEMLLAQRNFRGRVKLDHKNKKLALEVEPDETRRDASGRNTKTLSGGEKSYSSICLLLAIWEAMGSPLRCLDEFDVFMDNVNRAISTKLLITAARRSVGRQYIFITPNAIEGAQAQLGDDVEIHRLTDPRQRRVDVMMRRQ